MLGRSEAMRAHNLATGEALVVIILLNAYVLLIHLDLADFEHTLNVVFEMLGIRALSIVAVRLRPCLRWRSLLGVEGLRRWGSLLCHLRHYLEVVGLGLFDERHRLRGEHGSAIHELRHSDRWRSLLAVSLPLSVREQDELGLGVSPRGCVLVHYCGLLGWLPRWPYARLLLLAHVIRVELLTALELTLEREVLPLGASRCLLYQSRDRTNLFLGLHEQLLHIDQRFVRDLSENDLTFVYQVEKKAVNFVESLFFVPNLAESFIFEGPP